MSKAIKAKHSGHVDPRSRLRVGGIRGLLREVRTVRLTVCSLRRKSLLAMLLWQGSMQLPERSQSKLKVTVTSTPKISTTSAVAINMITSQPT